MRTKQYFKRYGRQSVGLLLAVTVFMLFAAGCGQQPAATPPADSGVQTVTDMAGRQVTLPAKITKAYGTSPIQTILIYCLAPEKLAGLNSAPTDLEKRIMLPQCQNLPVLGGWFGQGNTGNMEEILRVKPDVIVCGHTGQEMADQLQQQLNIPVVWVDDTIEKNEEVVNFVGKVLGAEQQAGKMNAYFQKTQERIKANLPRIAEGKKVSVYYAEGPQGLQTDPKGSKHAELLEILGAENIAEVAIKPGFGRSEVSMEQVLKWNPEVIIAGELEFYQQILNDQKWKNIKAVQDNRVYLVPRAPFNWFDRPPGVNRIIGLAWTGQILYPNIYSFDINQETKEFYKIYYHYDLKDNEVTEVLTCGGVAKM
ncbi:MAG: ABC transporter substrate-binding protein [Heliobacteriaceae bacterium]|nr:ABC transporter substrate-binding protein [Heliobacteriaceae bacterium]